MESEASGEAKMVLCWLSIDPLFNDLKFAHDNLDVDPDDDDEVYMAIINDLEIGGGIYNTDNLNPYGYGYNNPVAFDDPDGRCPMCVVALVAFLMAPEVAMAPTRDKKADYQAYKGAKDLQANVLLSAIPGGGARNATASVVLRATVKNQVKEKVKDQVKKTAEKVTSKEARREVMRKEGIPTSQQPKSQSKNASGREYTYETSKKGGGTETKSVQQQTKDRSHEGQPHWEAGKVKTNTDGSARTNDYGRPKIVNQKSKVDYTD